MVGGRVEGAVERVEEGGVEGAEGELGDDVGEVESWMASSHTCQPPTILVKGWGET